MTIFLSLFVKIIPLYFLIGLGFVSRRFLEIDARSLARTTIYLVAPVVIFHSGFNTDIQGSVLILPLLFCLVGYTTSAIFYFLISPLFFKDSRRNLLSCAVGNSNTGYFGLPVVLALLGQEAFTLAVLVSLGSLLFENTLGVFLLARGQFSARQSFFKLFKLPALYAFSFGLLLNVFGLTTQNSIYTDTLALFKGAYVILGMMIIGSGIATVEKGAFDFKLISLSLIGKLMLFPSLMVGLLAVDSHFGPFLTPEGRQILWILSLCPVAANTVAYATEFKLHPEKAARLVFLSTLAALVYIPLVYPLFGL